MGRASRAKAARRSAELYGRVYGPRPATAEEIAHINDEGNWFKIGVCKACGRVGQITTAERMCAPAPPGYTDDRAESCLAIAEHKRARSHG